MTRIAVLASGGGSNAEVIMQYFNGHDHILVACVISNKADAGVLAKAKKRDIPTMVIDRSFFKDEKAMIGLLKAYGVDYLILAGFLWLIPTFLIRVFPDRILNIHPSLLPKYGGKGMYGHHVHEAVSAAGDHESGMTIHLVNEEYDKGEVLYQGRVKIKAYQDADLIASAVLVLEHQYYAPTIEQHIMKNLN
jgi:phosphoribosylglycinamide formyltransferase 1